MFNFGGGSQLPSADPPYPVNISRDGIMLIKTDNCGMVFEILGDKHQAAIALLERGMQEGGKASNLNYHHREGAFDFVFENKKLVDITHYYSERIFGPTCPSLVEKRPEVFEIIEIMKSVLKLKVFL